MTDSGSKDSSTGSGRADAPDASNRLAFLARASELLVAAPSNWAALERLAELVVPALADWCTIDILDDAGHLTRVAIVHSDPSKVEIAAELERRYPTDPDAGYGVPQVLRTGASQLYPDIPREQVEASAHDEHHRELIRRLGGFTSAMIVPLNARGKTLGAITLVSSESERHFGPSDLSLAEALARRAALAAEKARLAEEVSESERRLEGLVNSLDAIVWEADPATRAITYVSGRAEDILGYPIERWVKEPGFRDSIIHRGDLQAVRDAYARAEEAGGGNHDFEYRMIAADGRTVWIRDLMYVARDDEGRPERLSGIIVDVTQRVEAERRARAVHAVTTVLAESGSITVAAPGIVQAICHNLGWDAGSLWIADAQAGVLRCEAAWGDPALDVSGYLELTRRLTFGPGEGLPGRVWASGEPLWIADGAMNDQPPRGPIAVGEGLHSAFDFPIVLRGVVLGVLEFFSRKILEPDDDLRAMLVAIGTQIGRFVELAESAQAVRERDARTRAMLGASLDGFISIDHEGRVIEFNPASERTFGFKRADVIGKELASLIIPEADRDKHRAGLRRYRETRDGPMIDQRMELTALRADGSEFPVEVALAAVDTDPPIFTAYVRDITEEKSAERALRESRERLAFLAEASALLSSSLNYRTVLERLANLAVPAIADWCAVDVFEEDGSLKRIAVAHADPAKREVARQLAGAHPDHGEGSVLGSVLASREALITRDAVEAAGAFDGDTELRGVVDQLGHDGALVVPLVARGRTLGALTLVAATKDRSFGSMDLTLAEDLARRAALAVDNARLFRERSYVARTLQRSLLPPHLPQIPGVEVAARYHAAGEGNEVGGDFYDLFRTGKDDWAIVIGDVCGKGADAAAVTALARYTLRAAAMQARKPSRVLSMLNDALLADCATRDAMDQRFCTVAYARLRPNEVGVRLTTTSAGHPVPLILRADGRVETACKVGTLVGVLADPSMSDRSTELAPGDVVVFYTDGVTEARGPSGVFGEVGIRNLVSTCGGYDATTIVELIERAVLDFQDGTPRDDIALMVLRVTG